MIIRVKHNNKEYTCDLGNPIDISIAISNKRSPKAFYAPDVEFNPLIDGEFIGSLKSGSPGYLSNISTQ